MNDFNNRRKLDLNAKFFEAIIQSSDDAIISKTLDGIVTSWNEGAKTIFGYSADEMLGKSMQILFPPGRENEEKNILEQIKRGERVFHFETVRLRKDGTNIDVSVTISPIRDDNGNVIGASKIARSINERKLIQSKLHEKETQYCTAIETCTDGFLVLNQESKIVEVNDAYLKLSGYSREEILNLRLSDVEAQESPDDITAHIQKTIRLGHDEFETIHRTKTGGEWPVAVSVTFSPISGGLFFAFFKDLTEKRKSEQRIWHQANFDPLTDLPNRLLFFDRLAKALSQARRINRYVGLFFLDLDGFKPVNDKYGHDAGDIVLKTVSKRWLSCIRESDTVARLGGDEFAVIAGELDSPAEAKAIAEKLINALSSPIPLANNYECLISTSVGISLYPINATEIDSMLTTSDAAMYQSKAHGKNTYRFSNALSNSIDTGEWLIFDSSHLIGVDVIDKQHRQLVLLVNQVNRAINQNYPDGDIKILLNNLIEYTTFHFETEHRLMAESAYPDICFHDSEHRRLTDEVQFFEKNIQKGTELLALQTIKDWLIKHIVDEDKPLGIYLQNKFKQSV